MEWFTNSDMILWYQKSYEKRLSEPGFKELSKTFFNKFVGIVRIENRQCN